MKDFIELDDIKLDVKECTELAQIKYSIKNCIVLTNMQLNYIFNLKDNDKNEIIQLFNNSVKFLIENILIN
jgi:hypothetical protein